jgi:hypothetical protein
MNKKILLSSLILMAAVANAQQDSTAEEAIDFSQFAEMAPAEGTKRYCTSKVLDLSPNKLISIGFDYQGPHSLTSKNEDVEINSVSGMRISGNIPVISQTKLVWAVGFTHWQSFYDIPDHGKSDQPFVHNLHKYGLSTTGINTTLFKPLNERNFILAFVSADMNGNYQLNSSDIGDFLGKTRYSVAGFYGWKRNDRSMVAVGISRTYRPGALGYIPLVMFNHTFESRKWGVEALFPARAAMRRTFNPRNILLAGYELEGNSYHLLNRNGSFQENDLELKRSELRFRLTYEKSIYNFIWISVQAGYRVNYNFNVDRGDNFRSIFGGDPYTIENRLTNPFYFNISLNLVSP